MNILNNNKQIDPYFEKWSTGFSLHRLRGMGRKPVQEDRFVHR
jgi:hypothetical protein